MFRFKLDLNSDFDSLGLLLQGFSSPPAEQPNSGRVPVETGPSGQFWMNITFFVGGSLFISRSRSRQPCQPIGFSAPDKNRRDGEFACRLSVCCRLR